MTPQTHKRLGLALIFGGGVFYAVFGEGGESFAALLGMPAAIAGLFVYFRGRQKAAKAAAESPDSPLRDARADLLYLRSFQADTATTFKILTAGFTTEEEQLADVLRPFGDLVAIGRPGENLPLPGALRMYASDAEWKDVVLERMRLAPLVVIRASAGAGLYWEIEQARSVLRPEKLLLLILNLTPSEYRAFADHVGDRFKLVLPDIQRCSLLRAFLEYPAHLIKVSSGFIMFSEDWTPVFLPLPYSFARLGYNDIKKPFNAALRPVFERHGVAWRPVGRFR